MPADTLKLKQTWDQLRHDRANFDAVCAQLEKFIMPHTYRESSFPYDESSAEWTKYDLWDLTAPEAAAKLAASLQSSAMSPAIRWFKATYRNQEIADDADNKAALEENATRLWNALQASDFNTEAGSALIDFVVFGNMFVIRELANETKWEGFDFSCVPLNEADFIPDSRGRIVEFYRQLSWTARQMVDRFGEQFVPVTIKEQASTPAGATEKHNVVFCIFRRDEVKLKGISRGVKAPWKRPFGCVYFLAETGRYLGDPSKEGGYYKMPAYHVPYNRAVGSKWGYGPGHLALPTVKLLNALEEMKVRAAEKAIDPPLLADQNNVLSDPDLEAGGVTMCRDPKNAVIPLESHARFDLAEAQVEELRAMVRRCFHGDELALKDSPEMSATEAQIRYELMNRLLGATLAHLQSDFQDPVVIDGMEDMYRAKALKAMPAEAFNSGELAIEYQGPLARSQRTDEVASIERLAAFAAGLLKMGFTDIQDVFNPEVALREAAERLGAPAKCLASPSAAAKAKEARQALQQQMAQAEALRATGEAVAQAGAARQALPVPASPTPMVSPTLGG